MYIKVYYANIFLKYLIILEVDIIYKREKDREKAIITTGRLLTVNSCDKYRWIFKWNYKVY